MKIPFGTNACLLTASVAMACTMGVSTSSAVAQDRDLTIVLIEELADADICNMSRSTNGRVLRQNIGETLTEINPQDGSIEPRLATSWEPVDDRTWRFHLREGVTFHDGTPFTADAVVKTINRTFHNPNLFCENKPKSGMDSVKAVAVDAHTVDISLDKPAPILPVRMGIVGMTAPSAPTDALEVSKPIGTGPYKWDHWTAGDEIVLVRNEDYWGEKPVAERARYIFRTDSAVRAAMVKIGEADLAPNIAVQDATDPEMDYSFLNSETSRLRIETFEPPLDDKRVREALHYALDREALHGSVFSKDTLHATQLFVPTIAGHNHELKVRPYDPEKAKALLAEAKADGAPVDRELTIICRLKQWPGAQESMQAILAYYQAVGLNIKLRCIEQAQHSDMNSKPFNPNRGPILFQDQHDNNNGDPVFTAHTKYGCDGIQSTMCDRELDKLIAKATALPTGEERVNTWKEVFRRLHQEIVGDVPLFHMVGYTRVGERINFQPTIATNTEVQLADITFN